MAIDAAQLLAELTKNVDAHKTRAMAGNEAMAWGPMTQEAKGGVWDQIRPRLTSKYDDNIAAAGQMDALNREAAAGSLQGEEQARALSDVLVSQGLDPRQVPGIGGALAGSQGPAVAQGLIQNPMMPMQEGMERQMLEQQAMAEQAQMGQFGSGIQDYQTFQQVAAPIGTAFRGAENVGFLADVVEQLTPAQMKLAGGGKLIGQMESSMYQLYPALQGMSESKDSTLREAERKAIDDFVGNPTGFMKGVFSRDPVTVGKLRSIEGVLNRKVDDGLVGLDDTSLGFLQQSHLRSNPDLARYRTPEGTIRQPQRETSTKTTSTPEEAQAAGFENLAGLPIF